MLDPRSTLGVEPGSVVIAIGRVPAHPGAGGNQQAQLGAHEFARANQQDLAALQIQEHRQKAHPTLAFPKSGVD